MTTRKRTRENDGGRQEEEAATKAGASRRPSRSSTRRRSRKKRAERAAKKAARAARPSAEAPRGPGREAGPGAPARPATRRRSAATLMKEFGYKNAMQVPRLVKITINMGLGEADHEPKIIDTAVEELRAITGQTPVVTRAKKSIATFKLREGQKIGAMVTLRRERMWEFLDRLVNARAAARPRLQRRVARGVRRPRQLHARHPRADHLPRDQLRQDRQDQGHEHHRSSRPRAPTTRVARCSRHLGMPFRQLGDDWSCSMSTLDRQASARSRSSRSAAQPLPALRPVARVPAQVRDVPPLLPRARAARRHPGRHQVELVRERR